MLQGQIQNLILPDRDPEGEKKVPDEDERKGMQIWEGEKSRGHKLCERQKVVAKREATKEKDANKCIREFKSKP